MSLIDQIYFQNHHWTDRFEVPSYHRVIFQNLIEVCSNKFIITLIGTRRVGKTTLLKQLIKYLITNEQVQPEQILFFSLDLYSESLFEIYQKYIAELKPSSNGKIFLIFDEIQYLNNWASHAKLIYDNQPDVKIFLSGSSASDLFRGRESLAGREIEIIVHPLSFSEYLDLSGKNAISRKLKWDLYLHYMDHQLPDLALLNISEKEYIGQLVDKIIHNDFRRLHNISDTRPVDTIFRIICKSPGEIIKLIDLSEELNLDWRTVQNYLSILEKALLIRKVYNFSRNPRKSEKRKIRYYPHYTSLHWYTRPYVIELGKKAETEVAFQTNAEYFWNERSKDIDFIVGNNLEIGIEVKMRNSLSKRHIKSLMTSNLVEKKFVITKYDTRIKIDEIEKNIQFLDLSEISSLKLD